MSEYYAIIIWMAILTIFSILIPVKKNVAFNEVSVRRYSFYFVALSMLPLVWWCIQRGAFEDSAAYISAYRIYPSTISEILEGVVEENKDRGFYVLTCLIKMLVGSDYKIYFAILAIFQAVSLGKLYRKYSSNYLISLFVFIASTDYLSWMQNGIRQFMAVTLILFGTEWIIQKKYIRLIILIGLASTLHASALLMIPVVFIVQGTAWNKKTILAIIACFIAILYVDRFTDILEQLLSDTQYVNTVSDWTQWEDNGTNPLRVLVYSVPTILSIIGLKFIKHENNPIINIACNMGILATAVYLLSMVTSGVFIGRLPIYFSLYSSGILLPWELENMFVKNSKVLIISVMVIAYLLFYYYQIHITWGLI